MWHSPRIRHSKASIFFSTVTWRGRKYRPALWIAPVRTPPPFPKWKPSGRSFLALPVCATRSQSKQAKEDLEAKQKSLTKVGSGCLKPSSVTSMGSRRGNEIPNRTSSPGLCWSNDKLRTLISSPCSVVLCPKRKSGKCLRVTM